MNINVYTDGGSRGNPGPAAIGVVINEGSKTVHEISKSIGIATNNIAEYTAVLEALKFLQNSPSLTEASLSFYLDSLLVVEQLNGRYKMKNPGLLPLFQEIKMIQKYLPCSITFSHVPRAQNAHADLLVNKALDLQLKA